MLFTSRTMKGEPLRFPLLTALVTTALLAALTGCPSDPAPQAVAATGHGDISSVIATNLKSATQSGGDGHTIDRGDKLSWKYAGKGTIYLVFNVNPCSGDDPVEIQDGTTYTCTVTYKGASFPYYYQARKEKPERKPVSPFDHVTPCKGCSYLGAP